MKTLSAILGAGLLIFMSPAAAQDQATQVASATMAPADQQKVPDNALVDSQPEIKKRVDPVYPREALEKGIEGKVWVKVLVDTAGRPAQVEILKSANPYFDQMSITAARQWVFTPAMKDKKPVAAWVTLPFVYKLGDKDGEGRPHKKGADAGLVGELMQKVDIVFAGDPGARAVLNPEAYLVDGDRFVSLNEAMFGKEKGKCFAGEKARKRSFMKVVVADDQHAATLVFKTENAKEKEPRWHTITWAKGGEGDWKITHWHTSR